MATYKARYYNVNGPMTTLSLDARTLLGAKREAYAAATGDQNKVVIIEGGYPVAERVAPDSFHGFCLGAGRWQDGD